MIPKMILVHICSEKVSSKNLKFISFKNRKTRIWTVLLWQQLLYLLHCGCGAGWRTGWCFFLKIAAGTFPKRRVVCSFVRRWGRSLASPAMRHWGTCPLDFQLFNFSGYFRAARTLNSTACGCLSSKNYSLSFVPPSHQILATALRSITHL